MTTPTADPPHAHRHADPPGSLRSVEEARDAILAAIPNALPTERAAPVDALGRVCGEGALATTDLPPWDNSAMDGYAILAADVAAATEAAPVRLRVIGEVQAGHAPSIEVRRGEVVRIATGARMPPGADAVVQVELTTPVDGSGVVGERGRDATGALPSACLVHAAVSVGEAIRRKGSDLHEGSTVLAAGAVVTPAAVAVLAGAGVGEIAVHARPRVAVLATGDEVRQPGEPLGPAGIPDANGPSLRALVAAAGGIPIDLGVARDDLEDLLGRLRTGLETADAIVVSGGVSVGPYDVVRSAFDAIGQVDLWRVAVQPGKPFAFGLARPTDQTGDVAVPLFGLPGNPVSTAVTFELFVRPAIRRLAGHRQVLRPPDRAVMLEGSTKSAGRRAFLRVTAKRGPNGEPARDDRGRVRVRLAGGQGSHVLSALAAADALAVIPEGVAAAQEGDEVELLWLDGD